MPAFQYQAISKQGKKQQGVLQGDSERHIRQLVRDLGLMPISVKVVGNTTVKPHQQNTINTWFNRPKKIKTQDLSLLTRQIATLINAALPIDEVLQSVAAQTEKKHISATLLAVRAKVLEGHSLADALANFPTVFPPLYRATIKAGEKSGHLDQILLQLADYVESQQTIKQKIQQALIYPTMMTLVATSIVVFLLNYVVPKMVGVFTQTKQSLPLATEILIKMSHGIHHYGLYGLMAIIGAIIVFTNSLKNKAFKKKWHHFLLKLPIIGKTIKTIQTARFARTFGILFAATVPVLEAIEVATEVVSNIPIQVALQEAKGKIREGTLIHLALKDTQYFSAMTLHLIANGEASGQLNEMLSKAADTQENDVKLLIESGLTLFEPILTVLMGAVVLFIVLAIMLPIFNLDQFNG